nr:hypothetical protein [Tanacetum cinerariifolium]
MPAPDQPQDHLSTPPRQQTSNPNALVFEHGQSSDLNTASFSRSHETDAGPFTNVDDEPLDDSFHMFPPRSTQALPAGQPSSGAEDPITLTALSSVVSTYVQKVNSLETEFKDHKKLFKDVVGNVAPAGVSNKGKYLIVEEDIPVKARTFKQMQEDILARMAALIKRKKQALAEKLAKERYSMARVKSFTDAQLKEEFEK